MKCAGETFIFAFNRSIFLISFFSALNFQLCFSACARAEYKTNGECCPMCAPGNRVYKDCTEYTSTTCAPCIGATFLDAPNGLKECFSCAVCDPVLGLRVKTACTRTSDTVCEPLEKYYCIEENRGSCIHALKHTTCRPGEYIKKMGTPFTDTKCDKCAGGTFSNGSNQICQPHLKCEDRGLSELKPGTDVSDTECGNKTPVGPIVGSIVAVILLAAAPGAVFIYLKMKRKARVPSQCTALHDHKCPQQETEHGGPSTVTLILQSDRSDDPGPDTTCSGPEEASDVEESSYGQ